jgi:glutamyl-tRNA reductase
MTLFVAGLNHKTASVDVRESLAVEQRKLGDVLRDVQVLGVATELVILSTCNRVEVYGVAEAPGLARAAAFRELARFRGVDAAAVEPVLYTHVDGDAVRHAFRVAASLDSMVLGEPQILGQVKGAFALAQTAQTVGPALHALFSQAFAVAKRVRTETELGRHAVSVSFAAVELAKKIFTGLAGRAVLLVGAGKMSELAARHLVKQGAFPLYVTNRTWARAHDLARALSGRAVAFDDMLGAVGEVDIVITSTAAPRPFLTRADVAGLMARRRARPLFFIDIAVPRNVESAVNTLDDVYCYDIDDLRSVVDANLRERLREAQRAESMVEREVAKFLARLSDLEVVPTIVSLRERAEAVRVTELYRALARLPAASRETREAMEAMSTAIVNKILHTPITKLRASCRAGTSRSSMDLVQELFGLGRRA